MPATTNSTIPAIEAAPRAKAATIATGAITNARTARSRLPMFLMRYLLAIAGSFLCRVLTSGRTETGDREIHLWRGTSSCPRPPRDAPIARPGPQLGKDCGAFDAHPDPEEQTGQQPSYRSRRISSSPVARGA